eukprot:2007816-Amphidinium_carterae.1
MLLVDVLIDVLGLTGGVCCSSRWQVMLLADLICEMSSSCMVVSPDAEDIELDDVVAVNDVAVVDVGDVEVEVVRDVPCKLDDGEDHIVIGHSGDNADSAPTMVVVRFRVYSRKQEGGLAVKLPLRG